MVSFPGRFGWFLTKKLKKEHNNSIRNPSNLQSYGSIQQTFDTGTNALPRLDASLCSGFLFPWDLVLGGLVDLRWLSNPTVKEILATLP